VVSVMLTHTSQPPFYVRSTNVNDTYALVLKGEIKYPTYLSITAISLISRVCFVAETPVLLMMWACSCYTPIRRSV
jgi:hypothetical protein